MRKEREKEQNKETKSQFYEINNRLTVCFFNKKMIICILIKALNWTIMFIQCAAL